MARPRRGSLDKEARSSADVFRTAINSAEHLKYEAGLLAIRRGEGKGQIRAEDPGKVLGSCNMDLDCRSAFPNANRWDYVIGYDRHHEAIAFYVEVHSAISNQVSQMAKKLDWLNAFLLRDTNTKLQRLQREYHWVASGRVRIPRHTPQYRALQRLRSARKLQGPAKELVLR